MFKKSPLTTSAIIVIILVVFFSVFKNENWNREGGVIESDTKFYYPYLPAIFINGDLSFENIEPYVYKDNLYLWHNETEDGKRYIRGTYGLSLFYSPFFFAGHGLAAVLGEPMNGFSYPYRLCLNFSGLFYLFFGLLYLSKLLRKFFEDHVVSITLFIVALGTNLLFYSTDYSMYSHAPNFMLGSLMLYASMMWFETHRWKWTIIIGFCGALMALIRPIDFIFILFLPLIGIVTLKEVRERIKEIWQKRWHFIVIGIIFVLVFAPQFIYNYSVSGSLFFYSYNEESFFFGNPHILDAMFSYRNGWLLYSPLMIFSLLGMVALFKQKRKLGIFVVVTFGLYLYVLASWWCWWYVGFGNRAFINVYPILAIPLAAFVHFIIKRGIIVRFLFKAIVLVGLIVSAYQTYQYHIVYIHWSDMTEKAYWDSFLNLEPSQLYHTYMEPAVIDRVQQGEDCVYKSKVETLSYTTFDFETASGVDSTLMQFWDESEGAINIPEGVEFIGNVRVPTPSDANEIYLTTWVGEENWGAKHIVLNYPDEGFMRSSQEEIKRKDGKIKVHCYMTIPEGSRGKDVSVYYWDQNKSSFTWHEFSIAFRKRTQYVKCYD
ncbi:MAG: ArnT family glycosyltransferase [Crocinitomicaceae bacterium]